MRRILGIAILAVGTAVLPVLSGAALAQGRAAPVQVDEVISGPLSQTVPVLGRLVPKQRGVVAALTGGPVREITVDVGDRVTRGDVILRIDTDRMEQRRKLEAARVTEARARVRTARANLEQARLELDRFEKLRNSAAFSQARYEDQVSAVASRESEVAEALAVVNSAQADLELMEIDVRLSDVLAPYDGVVVTRHAEAGSYLAIGDPVVTIVNDKDLEIEADVPTLRVRGLREGRAVEAELSQQGKLDAFVRAVVPEENALTRTRIVRFSLALDQVNNQPGIGLAANQTITVFIPVGEAKSVVSVHKDAVIARGNGFSVFTVSDGKAAPRPVTLGEAIGGRFEVIDGLAPGELVVVRGNERLRPGQAVTFPGMAPPPETSGAKPDQPAAGASKPSAEKAS